MKSPALYCRLRKSTSPKGRKTTGQRHPSYFATPFQLKDTRSTIVMLLMTKSSSAKLRPMALVIFSHPMSIRTGTAALLVFARSRSIFGRRTFGSGS